MSNSKIYSALATLLCLTINYSYGQGCSDAGFCTISSFKPNNTSNKKDVQNQFKIGAFTGKADNSIAVYGSYFEYNKQLNEKLGVDAKLTTISQNGNGLSNFGLSDLFINANYRASEKMKLILGTKIPLSKSNKSFENLPLPMDYQSSLGTLDLIFGIGYQTKKMQFVAAIQQPLTQNSNQFIASNYPSNSKLKNFQSTNKFQRSGDVLLRISYPIRVNSKLKFTPSFLPIYHLANDTYTDEFSVVQEISNSKGLTFNSNIYFDYELSSKNFIQLNFGVPFVVRKSRPDGLTRSFIANLEYTFKF